MHAAAGGQNRGEDCGGHDGHPANDEAASVHSPLFANVCRALQHIVTELQPQHRQHQVGSSSTAGEDGRASADDSTPAHLAFPVPRASASCTDVACSTSPDTAEQQCERRRLLFLAEWAQRVAAAYAPIMPSAAQEAAALLLAVHPVSHDAVTQDAAAAVADAALETNAAASISGTKADLPPVRCASVPVERRLIYPDGYVNTHADRAASVSVTTHSDLLLLPHTIMTAAAAVSHLSSPPPPITPRDRAPLCRVVGEPFDVPATRAEQRAVLAAQGGCCARCGVVLPQPQLRFPEWCSARTRSICTRLTSSCCYLQCSCCGGGQTTTMSLRRGRFWRACMCLSRCSSSAEDEEDGRSTAVTAVHVTPETTGGAGGGRGGVRHNARAPLDAPESEDFGGTASECDGLLGGGTRSNRHSRTRAGCDHHRSDRTGDGGGGTPADASFLFCTYEGHYLCLRCFHTPLTAAGLGAAMSTASAAAASAVGGTCIPEDYQTRYVAPEEWQAHASSTASLSSPPAWFQPRRRGNGGGEGVDGSSARAALARASDQLHEWWLARHVAHPTPAAGTLTLRGSRAASGLDHPPQQHTASPLHLCILPAHALHRWDFTRFPVSAVAAAVLQRRCYPGSAHGRESCLSPGASGQERGRQRTTVGGGGGGGVRGKMSGDDSPILLPGEEQGARGHHNALAIPPPPALEHVPYLSGEAGAAAPAMGQLPELYDVSVINPSLYVRVPALASALRLRQRMSLLHAQAWWCPQYRHEVWGLRSGDELVGQALEGATALSVAQQPPGPSSTVKHALKSSPTPAAVVESAVDSAEFYLLTQDVAPPPNSSWAVSSASRLHSVATPQTASLSALSSQAHSNLSGRVDGTSSPHRHLSAVGVAAVPLTLPTGARFHARRRYLVERAEGWSLQDLHRLTTPSSSTSATVATASSPPLLLTELQSMFDIMQAHLNNCSVCAAQCRGLMVKAPLGLPVCRD
ncbi:hypothetical protein LMJF_03_0280 [Leishmania major strain Friedlin]|uniref:Rubicon Homology domain-containing protein n=1 Tax=Leishmania major TaxID=5664 RepID=E9ACH5_LEIMA|nr:hypothetical protein LMJF_03_0280 [Leishmania major strain Friedlin]CAG9567254.1 hypothetical_protein_-_conserved [Leishmania major strain Friedlin]CBZ11991.1 hypothetical protein LMJF_03_0280 [Leishmania major strain Friedlin]|eukprot:XP_003721706.1 hypothetical protein LMJF_03_0280 [Leishmania major strain Friedlin]